MEGDDQSKSRPGSEHTKDSSQTVRRRSSKKSSSRDRHGKFFRDQPRERTVRAVTPESPTSSTGTPIVNTDPNSLTYQSPRSRLPYTRRDYPASVSNTDEESALEGLPAKGKIKPKRRVTATSDTSPNSFVTKTRHRLEAVTATAPIPLRLDENVGSIGFPSVIQPQPSPDSTGFRQQVGRTSRRTLSSVTQHSSPVLASPSLMTTDSKKILQLMKTTCGRMHGILFYRPTTSEPWASGYCAINVAPGSLVCQSKGNIATTKILIPDLRGCSVRTHYDAETQSTYLSVVTASSGVGYQFRPPVPETFDSWLAALLCWQPLPPKGLHNKVAQADISSQPEKWSSGRSHISDVTRQTGTAVVKTGKLHLWDAPLPIQIPPQKPGHVIGPIINSPGRAQHSSWHRVSCILHENAELQLLAEPDGRILSSVQLTHLSRSAIQPLHASVLGRDFCLAFFTQYAANHHLKVRSRPTVTAFDSQASFEEWLVILRAYATPELYGPEQIQSLAPQSSPGELESQQIETSNRMFRLERLLTLKLTEVRLRGADTEETNRDIQWRSTNSTPQKRYYAEVLLDRDLRARSSTKTGTTSAFWAEEFSFEYLAPFLTRLSILIKVEDPAEREWTMITHGPYDLAQGENSLSSASKVEILSHDTVYGRIDIQLDEIELRRDNDRRWPVLDSNGHAVGDLLMRVNLQEVIVLMQEQYKPLSALLHNFSNRLTPQLAQILGSELKQLSEVFLDIFQVSGYATEWLNNLVEEEVDGIYKEGPPSRLRFTGRVQSNDSYESGEHRELFVRDMHRSANNEASLLFRGNSLATKALDAHMRRLGKDYLVGTLGPILRDIVDRDPECEVDPIRIKSAEQMGENWKVLIAVTSSVWNSIADSGPRCPLELRGLFKHIRSCAEDRYGSFNRTVKYTSVSGFLFLRLFCPAILNPELFGLLRERPPERSRRTLTLIAKSLIVLANMTKFGTKEPWMEPMNKFLLSATTGFRSLIEQVTSINQRNVPTAQPDTYENPMQILSGLSTTAREGSPSLPYLLDSARSHASLVNLWMEHASAKIVDTGVDDCVKMFHDICCDLHKRTTECLNDAEQAPRPDEDLEPKWQQLLAERQKDIIADDVFDDDFGNAADGVEMILPRPSPKHYPDKHSTRSTPAKVVSGPNQGEETRPPSSASIGWDQRRLPISQSNNGDARGFTTSSTNSSSLSLEALDEARPHRPPNGRDGSAKNRLFDLLPTRRKGRNGGGGQIEDDDRTQR